MSRLIDADELKAFYKHWDSEYSGEELKEYKRIFDSIVDQQPKVDAVPVVRCKDCIHYIKRDCWTENGRVTIGDCWNDQGIFTYVLDNDYCSRGYRRDNNGNGGCKSDGGCGRSEDNGHNNS